MSIILLLASIVIPIIMFVISKKRNKVKLFFDGVALVSAITFGNIAATSIYEILKDKTVFMTNIHGIFLNPLFLLTGSYLGLYLIYQLPHIIIKR
ncbi:hypothetical protein [Ornithinibacillus scapharcae]|uniref:hypothetical protein n=1 Tax=Ornithinibacillus scapharcae TaxID=1147159 RepID=UPI000225BE24|nr:hypothetical protein [Ornithinibacillus scapharcae]